MTKVKIVTDSTADLSKEQIRELGISVVPLSITIDGVTFLDRVDITPKEFLTKMKQSAELPKSSQPAVGHFVELYDQLGSDGSEILSIHMTGGMSGTVASAENAARLSESKVTVIDSMYISRALVFQVVEAAKMANAGHTMDEIVKRIEEIRENTTLFVTVDTLENLVKGGRIGKGKALIGSILNIKPIASLQDGVYTPVSKVRSHAKIVKYLSEKFAEDVKDKMIKGVAIAQVDAVELASNLKDAIKKLTGYEDVDIVDTTPVISTHTGPGAIGFMYYVEIERKNDV
ncbi:DegV family protein [Bacillus sp. REN16]|uniref:DegV family protein n=1 Tax=Bacillus sp. REN16 TaxID=2887296 RepID=UPI001E3416EC|nr:DegV family protein [Bacillus sp. REN16]MCC3357088.1 DegV family protein [Bacillus sp. REN16]